MDAETLEPVPIAEHRKKKCGGDVKAMLFVRDGL